MPKGAIVVANHAEKWMLEPEFLKRAGGFVFAEGGFNDHVAILMRQEEKTLMLAGEQFAAVAAQEGQQATLACARFNGQPGAFIVVGDYSGKLASCRSLSSAFSDEPLAKAVPSKRELAPQHRCLLRRVASCFRWLTDQNALLLSFFAPGGGLGCLANPIKLSMSPQRAKLLGETRDNVNRLIYGAEEMLEGYDAFLRLAGKSCSREVQSLRDEFPELGNRFGTLKETIQSRLESIVLPMQAAEEGRVSRREFCQWVAACQQLQSSLQALNPGEAEQVRSVHELIFALHQRFVEALAPVTLASGQGRSSKIGRISYVDCTTPCKKTPLLSRSGEETMARLEFRGTVIHMNNALIVTLPLGNHKSVIELLEHAEAGKGRTLRLTFSDTFDAEWDFNAGKFMRVWFLVALLKAIELDKNSDGIKTRCNAIAGTVTIECSQMKSRPSMREAFEKLIVVLRDMKDLDHRFEKSRICEKNQWNFDSLAQRLDSGLATEADRFVFQHCLFTISYTYLHRVPRFYPFLSDHQQQFIEHVQCFSRCVKTSEHKLLKMLMSGEIAEDTRSELLQHYLLEDPQNGTRLVVLLHPHLEDQYFVIKTPRSGRLEFDVPPGQPFGDYKEKVRNSLLKQGLKYASQRVLNDKDVVLPAIKEHPGELEYVSKELGDDSDVVIASVTRVGGELKYASHRLKNDEKVVMAAVANDPAALGFASERIKSDKDIVNRAIAHSIIYLRHASHAVLNDREYMLELIEQNPRAFEYAAFQLKNDKSFIDSAKQRNPEVNKYVRAFLAKL